MVDLHHHLLHGLDDGSPDLATSIAMARMAASDGITHIVCTPHASGRYPFDPATVSAKVAELRAALAAQSVPLTLGAGCDFHLSYDNIQDALAHHSRYTINASTYLLIELPDYGIPPRIGESFYELQLAGFTLILTHPERNPTLQQQPDRLADFIHQGLLMQVTAGSVLGHMGKEAERLAHELLDNRWAHFLATDAHNLTSRPPLMRAAADLIARRYDPVDAERLTIDNPLAVFNGEPIPAQPQRVNLNPDYEDDDPDPPTRWWQRLLGSR
jgi:protein-tyrosine phosphatase